MSTSRPFFQSSIGRKTIMAVTGVMLLGFVILHLLGNLQLFLGPETLNHYAKTLRDLGALLWVARIILLAAFALHIVVAIQLKRANLAARPVAYAKQATIQASKASLWMFQTGMVILAFVILHLAHFTFGKVQPEFAEILTATGDHDVYAMVYCGFHNVNYASIYIVCMLILGLHLSHGIASFFQTLGFNHPKYSPCINRFAPLLGWLLALGYISMPVAVLAGLIAAPAGGICQ